MQERPCGATGGVVGELWKICPAGLTRRITKNHEGTRRNTKGESPENGTPLRGDGWERCASGFSRKKPSFQASKLPNFLIPFLQALRLCGSRFSPGADWGGAGCPSVLY